MVEGESCLPGRTKIGDYVKHIFNEHDQEADHLTSLGADGTRKTTVVKGGNHERWKAVREFWGGSKKRTVLVAAEL